jgi:hypothetical protein
MAKRFKKLSDDEILVALEENLKGGIGHYDSVLSKERKDVLDYYHGKRPLPQHSGNSKYVSMDVWDTVESTKAVLLETFAAGTQIAEFAPKGPEDVQMAKVASMYTEHVLFEQNNGFQIFSDVIQDALLARAGIVQVYWDECIEDEEETFSGAPIDDLDMLLEAPDLELKDAEEDQPGTGIVSGTLIRKKDYSQVRIEVVPPEEFLIKSTEQALDKNTMFCGRRLKKTVSWLMEQGLTLEQAKEVPSDGLGAATDPDTLARFDTLANDFEFNKEFQEQAAEKTVYECYIRLDVEGTGKLKLWKFTKAGKYILDRQEVDRHPFICFVPLPIPHAFYGSNFASKVIPTQNARSILMRGILDHTVITNNPRYMVVKGSLLNPKEMLENRIGGLVNVTRPDGLLPLPQNSLNPFVFQTIQLLDEDKEDTTGVSKLSQGLNKDAVSKQNAQGLVENLVTLSMQRQKIIARNFANNFLVPLYLEIYKLVLEREDKQKIVNLAGNWVQIDPEQWEQRTDVSVSLKLGYGEQEREAQKFLALHQFMSSDPSIAPLYELPQKYNMLRSYYENKGIKNVDDYMIPASKAKPPEPPPDYIANVEKTKAETQALTAKVDIAAMQAQHKAEMEAMKVEMDKMFKQIDMMVQQRDMERKEFDSETKRDIAMREMDILEATPPMETKQTQIVSPNS